MTEFNTVTPELLARIDRVNKDCIDLHMPPPPVAFITLEVEDGKGNLVHRHHEKANSWNRNLYNINYSHIASALLSTATYGAGSLAPRSWNGGYILPPISYFSLISQNGRFGAAGDNAYGIVVGSGTSAESFEDYQLQTLILHGTTTGKLSYQAGTAGTPTYDSGTKTWTNAIARVLNNNTADAITVNETGLHFPASINNASAYICVERNHLAAGVSVSANYKLTVTYTFQMTFPA